MVEEMRLCQQGYWLLIISFGGVLYVWLIVGYGSQGREGKGYFSGEGVH